MIYILQSVKAPHHTQANIEIAISPGINRLANARCRLCALLSTKHRVAASQRGVRIDSYDNTSNIN